MRRRDTYLYLVIKETYVNFHISFTFNLTLNIDSKCDIYKILIFDRLLSAYFNTIDFDIYIKFNNELILIYKIHVFDRLLSAYF